MGARPLRGVAVPGGGGDASGRVRYGALAVPRPVRVSAGPGGIPRAVRLDGRTRAVEDVRDDWVVQDRWWTDRPIERRYLELVLRPGRLAVLYQDLATGEWHAH